MKRGQTDLNFLIAINKPTGMTSHDVINKIRTITGEGRVGHMGTLDPCAVGAMLIGIGSAARLNNYLELVDKTYVVKITLGKTTNTYDLEGEVTQTSEVNSEFLQEDFVKKFLDKYVGVHTQKPPAFSAIKVDGKPAYKSAREGKNVDLPERQIEVYSAKLLGVEGNSWEVEFGVSKGTYIRSLVHDIGQDLGCGAFVSSLERTAIGDITLNDCYSIENFDKAFNEGDYRVLNAADLLGFPVVEADDKLSKRVKNGNSIRNDSRWNLFPGAKLSIVEDNKLQAIYAMEDLHELVCECKFSGAIALPEKENYCATLGVFDGFHEGHAFEVEECIADAKKHDAKAVAITFDIDPDELFVKDFVKLDSNEDRIAKLKASGLDEVCVLNFKEIQNLNGEEFLEKFFSENPPQSIHVGEGFKFGKKQSGDTDLLIKWGKKHGMEVFVHELVKKDGEVISSTRLRESK